MENKNNTKEIMLYTMINHENMKLTMDLYFSSLIFIIIYG